MEYENCYSAMQDVRVKCYNLNDKLEREKCIMDLGIRRTASNHQKDELVCEIHGSTDKLYINSENGMGKKQLVPGMSYYARGVVRMNAETL